MLRIDFARKIIVCHKCNGGGRLYERMSSDESKTITCPVCNGHRVVVKEIIENIYTLDEKEWA